MPTCTNNIVQPQILAFQARYATVLRHRRLQPVRPAKNPEQESMLRDIWGIGKLAGEEDEGRSYRERSGWDRLGWIYDEGSEAGLFKDVGQLGLECLVGE